MRIVAHRTLQENDMRPSLIRPSIMRPSNVLSAVSLALTLAVSGTVHAHDDMPQAWCSAPGSTPLITAQYSFTPLALQQFKDMIVAQAQAQKVCPADILGISVPTTPGVTCGIVDDWFYADQRALRYCSGLMPNASPADKPLSFVNGPTDFNNLLHHHDVYRFSDGNLNGVCSICTTPSVQKPPAGTN
jgi:hypothetical protein